MLFSRLFFKSKNDTSSTLKSNFNKHKYKVRSPVSQICAVMVKNGLLLVYGMTSSLPTILIPQLKEHTHGEHIYLDREGESWIGSIGTLSLPLGCLLSGVTVTQIGLKRNMQAVCIPFVLCCIAFKFAAELWQIYLAFAVLGFSSGLLEAPVVAYVAEITEPQFRGILTATGGLAIHIGLLIGFTMGKYLDWRNVALITGIGPLVCFVLLFFVPESPLWLIMKERYDDAKRSLAWLRGWTTIPEIEQEFQEILEGLYIKNVDSVEQSNGWWYKYTRMNFIIPMALLCFMLFLSQFTGATAIQTYAVNIFETLQSPIDRYSATILFGAAELVGCLPCIILINLLGKRILTFCSLSIQAACVIIVASFAYSVNIQYLKEESDEQSDLDIDHKWLPLTFLTISGFAFQWARMIPWILMGEVFSRETNAIGTGAAGAIAFVFGFFANKIFLDMVLHMTLPGTFWFFGGLAILGLIVLFFWLPETEGKTLLEITNHFSGIAKMDNKVRRGQASSHESSSL